MDVQHGADNPGYLELVKLKHVNPKEHSPILMLAPHARFVQLARKRNFDYETQNPVW
jgi:hypothetical protein